MARIPESLTSTTQLSTTAASLFDTPSGGDKIMIRVLSFFNTSATTNRKVTVYKVESAGTAGVTNSFAEKTIAPRQTWNCVIAQGRVLEAGQTLQAVQDVGTDVNVNADGMLIS